MCCTLCLLHITDGHCISTVYVGQLLDTTKQKRKHIMPGGKISDGEVPDGVFFFYFSYSISLKMTKHSVPYKQVIYYNCLEI